MVNDNNITAQQAQTITSKIVSCLFSSPTFHPPFIRSVYITILPQTLLHTFTNKERKFRRHKRSSQNTQRKMRRKVENSHGTFCFSVSLQKVSSFLAFPLFTLAAPSHNIHTSIPPTINQKRKFLVFTQSATKGRNLPTT